MTPVVPIEVDHIVMEASSPEDRSFMRKMSKADVNQINAALVQKMYANVLKYNHCDFGAIPKSKGDISKVDGVTEATECLRILRELHGKHGIPTQDVTDILQAISTITRLQRSFEFGFKVNNDYLVITYNTIVMAIMDATSKLIADYTSYMVTPDDIRYQSVTKSDKKRGDVSIDGIRRFNSLAKNGTLDSTVNSIVANATKNPAGTRKKEEAVATESLTVAGGIALGAVITVTALVGIKALVTLIRELIFNYYHSKVKFADYLETQATFLEMNRLAVESSDKPASQKIKILQKQEKVILKLRRLADKIKINSEDMSVKGNKTLKDENSALTLSAMEKQTSSNKLNGMSIQVI